MGLVVGLGVAGAQQGPLTQIVESQYLLLVPHVPCDTAQHGKSGSVQCRRAGEAGAASQGRKQRAAANAQIWRSSGWGLCRARQSCGRRRQSWMCSSSLQGQAADSKQTVVCVGIFRQRDDRGLGVWVAGNGPGGRGFGVRAAATSWPAHLGRPAPSCRRRTAAPPGRPPGPRGGAHSSSKAHLGTCNGLLGGRKGCGDAVSNC